MAQDIGLLLRGLGAAFSQQVPQFRQEMAQRQQQQELERQRARQAQIQEYEFMQQRMKATAQDVDAALKMASRGDWEGIISLGEDRMAIDQQFGGPLPGDTTPAFVDLARKAVVGDPNAGRALTAQLAQTAARLYDQGILQLPEAYTLSPGQSRFVGNTKVASVPAAPAEQPTTFRLLTPQEVQQQGLEPGNYQINERTRQVSRVGAPSTVVNVGQATEGERAASILANRLDFAQAQIQDILATAPEAEKPAAGATALNTLGLEYLARAANPTERQIIEAAQMDMLDAALTLGTGAAYTKEQLEGYRASYFPQLGDDPLTITAKSQRLNNLVNAAYEKAGRAAPTERRGAQAQAPQDWIDAGLNQADWNALSQDDKKAYLEAQ